MAAVLSAKSANKLVSISLISILMGLAVGLCFLPSPELVKIFIDMKHTVHCTFEMLSSHIRKH